MGWKVCYSNSVFGYCLKIAITGATGFIGRHLVPLLPKEHTIVAIVRNAETARACTWLKDIELSELDISNFSGNAYLALSEPDILIHLAWDGLPNYKSTTHLTEGANQLLFLKSAIEGGLHNLTITGTCFEYGMQSGSLDENGETKPSNPYAVAKDNLRKAVEFVAQEFKCSFKWARLFYMYGDGQNNNSLIPMLEKAIAMGDEKFDMSRGEQLRDYLHVSDVAKNIIAIALQTEICGVVNCCSGEPISVRRLVEKIISEKYSKICPNLGVYPYPDYEPMAFWGKINNLNKIKGLYSE